VGTKYTF